ncbi:MAG: arsenite efflux transporter metallochaperone ArsD [Pauljensenia sp.]|uniref:arsenite efflux transporter metallochaperone ArsD n=1 Tax=Schaalia odontolytica TaxID=1660 RepID=UPI0009E5EEE9|nr:arsenite efflux transporter metallochaperone ArsD [Schaalia odontolytica]UUO93002.1 arsenite efflux transporter metallochaperone ArsD [Schaalia odontolytica]
MNTVHIYDPSLCCSSGVCGEDVDQSLVDISATLVNAKAEGIEVVRHNLANAPLDFAAEPAVKRLLTDEGSDALPAIVVNGRLVLSGRYPSIDELRAWSAGGQPVVVPNADAMRLTPVQSTSCCGGSACC